MSTAAIERCGDLHYIQAGAPYTFIGNEGISTIGGEVHGATTYKKLINLSPGSRKNLPNGTTLEIDQKGRNKNSSRPIAQ